MRRLPKSALLMALLAAAPAFAAPAFAAMGDAPTPQAEYQRLMALGLGDSAADNFAAAEAADRAALDIAIRAYGPNANATGAALMELALQVSNQQRFDEAQALFQRAEPIIQATTATGLRARLASYRALDAANRRDYDAALRFSHDAVAARQADADAARTIGADGNAVVPMALEGELVHALRIAAEMALRTGDLTGAEGAAQQALFIVSDHPGLPVSLRAEMVTLMGEIYARQGRAVDADRNLTEALTMDRGIYGETTPTILAELELGRFYAGEQLYPAAIDAYRKAFTALDRPGIARPVLLPDQILPFLAAASAVSAGTAERQTLDGEMFHAAQLFDNGVASQTIARVAARRAAENPALAAEVLAAEDATRTSDEARMALAAEHARPDGERDDAREKSLTAALPAAEAKSAELAAKLAHDFPAYARLANPRPVSLADVQGALAPGEAFVSFVIGQHDGFVLLVTPQGLTAKPITVAAPGLAAVVTDLRTAFVPRLGRLPDFSLANAATLYQQLLGPVSGPLSGVKHLTVAATGDLASLPFALLLTGDAAPRDYAHAPWLIRRMAVAEVPSASAFVSLHARADAPAPRPFLGVGNPDFQGSQAQARALAVLGSACQADGPASADLLRALPPLPDTAAEVHAVGRSLGAAPDDMLMGAGASEAAVRAKPLGEYAVLYFATHGLLPGELHCQAQPALVLSPPQGASATADDGLLTASEIAGLTLNARLVVLSACNTAAAGGNGFGGAALEGLADAFFDAGAHGVIASHWEVPSAETARLMETLFERLAHDPGHDAAEALRQAQLDLITQGRSSHPFNWAAFTLVGGA